MSKRTFKCPLKIVFPPSESDSTQQLDSVIFMWGKIFAARFQTLSGEEFDPRPGRSQDHPTSNLVGRPSATSTNVARLIPFFSSYLHLAV
jgi:hypothetical protein